MKQGETRRKQPKDKHTKLSWQKRDKARAGKQAQHKSDVELAAMMAAQDAEIAAATELTTLVVADAEQAAIQLAEATAAAIEAAQPDVTIRTSDYFREEGDPLRVDIIDACAGQQAAIDAQAAEQEAK